MARVSTMVNAISFLWLKGWHAPAGRRTCETPASSQARQIRPATPVGAMKTWDPGRQIVSKDNPERRQPIRRSGRDLGPRPYAHTKTKQGKQGRKHYPHPPCRLSRVLFGVSPL